MIYINNLKYCYYQIFIDIIIDYIKQVFITKIKKREFDKIIAITDI